MRPYTNEEIIKKSAQFILQHNVLYDGACIDMSIALRTYFDSRFGISLQLKLGKLINGDNEAVPHAWLEYDNKCLDLTSHKQHNNVNVRPVILKEKSLKRLEVERDKLPEHFVGGLEDNEKDKSIEGLTNAIFTYLDYRWKEYDIKALYTNKKIPKKANAFA